MVTRARAQQIVVEFEAFVDQAVMAGAGHPDLVPWHNERLRIARERLIRKLSGDPRPTERMPAQPEVDYDG